MKTKYSKTTWVNDETHLNENNMNNIENGLSDAIKQIDINILGIEENLEKINILNGPDIQEGSVAFNIRKAKEELIGTNADSSNENTIYGAKKLTKELEEYTNTELGELDEALSDEINRAQTKENELNKNISENTTNLNDHKKNTSNPHKVTATQLGVYTKDETYTRTEIENIIELSGGNTSGGESVDIDTTLTAQYSESDMYYSIVLANIANINPQNIYVDVTSKSDSSVSGDISISVSQESGNNVYTEHISNAGTYKFSIEKVDNTTVTVYYKSDSNADDTLVKVSYLADNEVLKLLEYIDFATVGNLITSGTADPNDTITSPYYFKYSE